MDEKNFIEILQRLAKLEENVNDLRQDVQCLQNKLNGYFDNRVKVLFKSFLGEIFIMILTSSAFVTLLINFLLSRR